MERKAHNSLNEAALQVQLEEAWSNPPGPTKEGNPRKRVVRDLKRKLGLPVSWHGGVGGDEPEYDPTGASRDLHKSRQDRKSKEARSAKKKELTRKKLYPKSGLKGEKKSFADRLFSTQGARPLKALEYFSNYFGDNLTEDTSDEQIMEAVYDLIDLAEAVLKAVGTPLVTDAQRVRRANRIHKAEWLQNKKPEWKTDKEQEKGMRSVGANLKRKQRLVKAVNDAHPKATTQDRLNQVQRLGLY